MLNTRLILPPGMKLGEVKINLWQGKVLVNASSPQRYSRCPLCKKMDIPDQREPLIPLNLSQHSGQTEPLEGQCRIAIPGNLSQFATDIPA